MKTGLLIKYISQGWIPKRKLKLNSMRWKYFQLKITTIVYKIVSNYILSENYAYKFGLVKLVI